jgi:hypothetical protein
MLIIRVITVALIIYLIWSLLSGPKTPSKRTPGNSRPLQDSNSNSDSNKKDPSPFTNTPHPDLNETEPSVRHCATCGKEIPDEEAILYHGHYYCCPNHLPDETKDLHE